MLESLQSVLGVCISLMVQAYLFLASGLPHCSLVIGFKEEESNTNSFYKSSRTIVEK